MESAELEVHISELETRLERLRALYEQYFMGIEKLEPTVVRKDVDRRLYMLRREQIRNTALRFRLNMIIQRHNTYQQFWQRICREIENGTYKRHVRKAAKRFGAEAIAIATKHHLGELHLDEDQDFDVDVELEDFNEEVENQLAPSSPIKTRQPSFAELPEWDQAFGPRTNPPPPDDADDPLSAFSDLESVFPDPPNHSSTIPAPPPPIASSNPPGISSTPPEVWPRSAPVPRIPTQPVQATPFNRSAPPSPQPPWPAQPSPRPAPPSPRPSWPGAQASLRPPQPAAQAPAAQAPAAQAQPPRTFPTMQSNPFPQAAASQPKPIPPVAAPPPKTLSPARPPPTFNKPGQSTSPGQPTTRPTMQSLAPQNRPAQAAVPAQPAQRATLPRPPHPEAAPASGARTASQDTRQVDDSGLSDARVREIYRKYVQVKRDCKESTSSITEGTLAATLRSQVDKLKAKHQGKAVDFEVVIKDGKAVLKPVIKGQ